MHKIQYIYIETEYNIQMCRGGAKPPNIPLDPHPPKKTDNFVIVYEI